MPEIRLTPGGSLHLDIEEPVASLMAVQKAFAEDWRGGLFLLAADKADTAPWPSLRFWQELAENYLTALCHAVEEDGRFEVAPLAETDGAGMVLSAPPMPGGEYLSVPALETVRDALDGWVRGEVQAEGGLEAFFRARAPRWHRTGRVCFHLAENKADTARPFAFMATYTEGSGPVGKQKHLPLKRALEHYAGEKNRAGLIRLLTPVHEAAKACPWVNEMVDSGTIYQPVAWPPEKAYQFLRGIPQLEAAGLSVRLPNWWRQRARPRVSVTIGNNKATTLSAAAMLDFDVRIALGDAALSAGDVRELLDGPRGLVLFKGQWIEVDHERLEEAIQHWEKVQRHAKGGEITFAEGMRLLAGAPADLGGDALPDEERAWSHVEAGDAMRALLEGLRDPGQLEAIDAGELIRATLRPYQREGVSWLHFLTRLGLGACLADDMGLGKTLQVLGLLACLREAGGPHRPSLLVVPASLLGNWRAEAARFAPSLKLVFLHPAEADPATLARVAKNPAKQLADTDLAVTTYSMLVRQEWLNGVDWRMVILDEAQAIKNPSTRQTRAVKAIPAAARVALTGTPVENRLGDLWSLFDFLNPGLLGSAAAFKRFVKRLEAREHNPYAPLRALAGPYILRRLKTDKSVIADLPDKTEAVQYCTLTKSQVRLYEQVVKNMADALDNQSDGMARRGLVLQTLMRLKQVCNHPSQLTGDGEYGPDGSGKFGRLAEICGELAERQQRVLVFTQFREIIDPLAAHLAGVFGREGLVLHGGTGVRDRQKLVDRFQQDDGPPFFLLSLKAGGTGLNLTAASHVVHFDRWWNPAVENQATDRAFRIGQKRNVLVHKFVTRGTVEERIDALINEKRELAESLIGGGGEVNLTELPDEELLNIVRLDVSRAQE